MSSLRSNPILLKQTLNVKNSLVAGTAATMLVLLTSCDFGNPPCDYVNGNIGVLSGGQNISIEFDMHDDAGRQPAWKLGCHPEASCPKNGCRYSISSGLTEKNEATLYVTMDGEELPPHTIKMPLATCVDDAPYIELDATKDPPVWSPVRTMKSCK